MGFQDIQGSTEVNRDQPSIMEPFQFPRKPRSGVRRPRRMFEDQADETIEQAKNSESNGPGELSKTVDTESQYQGIYALKLVSY